MFKEVVDFIGRNGLGDIASLAGVVISLVGFIFTIREVLRSKSAATQAKQAVESMQKALVLFDTNSKITSAIASMNEIKRLHRIEAWTLLPDRYASVRQELVLIRSANPDLQHPHRISIQGAIEQISDMEQTVEKALSKGQQTIKFGAAKYNAIISIQVDKLNEIFDALRQSTVEYSNGR